MADEAALDFETFDPNFERNLKKQTLHYTTKLSVHGINQLIG